MPRREVVEGRNSATVFIGCSQSIASQLRQKCHEMLRLCAPLIESSKCTGQLSFAPQGAHVRKCFPASQFPCTLEVFRAVSQQVNAKRTNGFHRSRLFRNPFWCAARVIYWCKIFISIQFYTSKPRSLDAFGLGPMGRNRGPIRVTLEKVRTCHYVFYRPSMPISLLYDLWRNAASHWFPPTTSEMWRVWYATSPALKQVDQELCWDLINPTNKPPQMVGHVGCLQVMFRRMASPTY